MNLKSRITGFAFLLVVLCYIAITTAQLTSNALYYPRAGIVCSQTELKMAKDDDKKREDKFKSEVSIPKDVSFDSTYYRSELLSANGSFAKKSYHKSFTKSYDYTINGVGAGTFSSFTCHYGKPYKGELDKLNEIVFTDTYTRVGDDKPYSLVTNAKVIPDVEIFLDSSKVKYTAAKGKENSSNNKIVFDLTFKADVEPKDLVNLAISTLGRNLFDGDFTKVLINGDVYKGSLSNDKTTVNIDISTQQKSFSHKLTIEFPEGYIAGSSDEFSPYRLTLLNTKAMDRTDIIFTGQRSKSGTSAATVFVIILLIVVIIAGAFFLFRCIIAKKCGKKKNRERDADSDSDVYGLLA